MKRYGTMAFKSIHVYEAITKLYHHNFRDKQFKD